MGRPIQAFFAYSLGLAREIVAHSYHQLGRLLSGAHPDAGCHALNLAALCFLAKVHRYDLERNRLDVLLQTLASLVKRQTSNFQISKATYASAVCLTCAY